MSYGQFLNARKLTAKQKRFIVAYLQCFNATRAAELAGYKGNYRTLSTYGHELLKHPLVRAEIEQSNTEVAREITKNIRKPKMGFVYLISEPFGRVKIGKANNWQSRFDTLNSANAYELHIIGLFSVPNPGEVERALHARFSGKRVRGEWFALSDQDIEWAIERYGKAQTIRR